MRALMKECKLMGLELESCVRSLISHPGGSFSTMQLLAAESCSFFRVVKDVSYGGRCSFSHGACRGLQDDARTRSHRCFWLGCHTLPSWKLTTLNWLSQSEADHPLFQRVKLLVSRSASHGRAIAESRGIDVSGLYAKCEVIKKLVAELNRAPWHEKGMALRTLASCFAVP